MPLVNGAADELRRRGIAVFGPSAAAARIEGSKAFAKDVMAAAGVPTAAAVSVTDGRGIDAALTRCGSPYVVKDDGLAAGKGVVVTEDRDAARAHAVAVLESGHPVLVEEYLAGPEVSLFAVCDGTGRGAAAAGPGLQAGRRRRRRPEHRRDGRLRAAAVGAGRTGRPACSGRCWTRCSPRWPAAARRSPGCSTPGWC